VGDGLDPNTRIAMNAPINAQVVNAFVDPVVHVIKACVGLDAEVQGLAVVSSLDPPPALSVTIELHGSLAGPVTWVFSQELARQVAAQMLAIDVSGVDPATANDAVAELANIVGGNATGRLADAGYRVEIRPPRVHADDDRELGRDRLAVTLGTRAGQISVVIGVIDMTANQDVEGAS
jgi:CheY-specific phosphatase CheX